IQEAFDVASIHHPLQVVRDGAQAIAYLRGDNEYSDRFQFPFPELAIMDIKMPKMSGLEVLEWIRANGESQIKCLPVIMLSASGLPEDVDHAHRLGVNAYLIKPYEFEGLVKLVRSIPQYYANESIQARP